tara:strand:+ start:9795 stop:10958 length:1164 start_codon:yes stop_codon:yes gene_type:complete
MDITVLICAHNAEKTIKRALSSIDNDIPILLIDDFSTDSTVKLAKELKLKDLRIESPQLHLGVTNARQKAIDSIDTKYGIWMDADDAFFPNRIKVIYDTIISTDVDFVFDSAELWSGQTNCFIKDLSMPPFLLKPSNFCRLFERNYLPGPSWQGFKTRSAKNVRYDIMQKQSEDLDFNLRAIKANCSFKLITNKGYKQFSYPTSLSRNVKIQEFYTQRALKKHSYTSIFNLYVHNKLSDIIAKWAQIFVACTIQDFSNARIFLNELEDLAKNNNDIIDPAGPIPFPDSWKWFFYNAFCQMMQNDFQSAANSLRSANEILNREEIYNNLGFILAHLNDKRAVSCFKTAQQINNSYQDPIFNLKCMEKKDIKNLKYTKHPLRVFPSRSE